MCSENIFVFTASPPAKRKALLEFGHMELETLSHIQTHTHTHTHTHTKHSSLTVSFRNDKVTLYWFKDTSDADTRVHIHKQKGMDVDYCWTRNVYEQQLTVQLHQRSSINLTAPHSSRAVIYLLKEWWIGNTIIFHFKDKWMKQYWNKHEKIGTWCELFLHSFFR